jgi:hypothetical protein
MTEPIRTTRLEVPVDANGLPIFAAVEASEIKSYVRLTRLYIPVTEDMNGNKIPVVALAGEGGGSGTGGSEFTAAYKEKVDTLWQFYSEIDSLVADLENL